MVIHLHHGVQQRDPSNLSFISKRHFQSSFSSKPMNTSPSHPPVQDHVKTAPYQCHSPLPPPYVSKHEPEIPLSASHPHILTSSSLLIQSYNSTTRPNPVHIIGTRNPNGSEALQTSMIHARSDLTVSETWMEWCVMMTDVFCHGRVEDEEQVPRFIVVERCVNRGVQQLAEYGFAGVEYDVMRGAAWCELWNGQFYSPWSKEPLRFCNVIQHYTSLFCLE